VPTLKPTTGKKERGGKVVDDMSSKAALGGPTFETDHEKISTQHRRALLGEYWKRLNKQIGVICVALDLEVAGAAVAVTFRGKAPRYFGKSSREEILGALKPLVALGNRVVCVQEICGFGYCFHRELQAAGVESLVVAPEALNGRRKTDKRDVGKLCLLLVDYVLRENREIFKVVRAPQSGAGTTSGSMAAALAVLEDTQHPGRTWPGPLAILWSLPGA
jgi:hypothetical protein